MAAQRISDNFNIAGNKYAHRTCFTPHPKFKDVYCRSNTFNHADGFTNLYIQDFIYTHARIAHRQLESLELTEAKRQLYRWGVCKSDKDNVPEVMKTCMAYARAIGVNSAEEAACLNDRVGCDGQGYFDLADNHTLGGFSKQGSRSSHHQGRSIEGRECGTPRVHCGWYDPDRVSSR